MIDIDGPFRFTLPAASSKAASSKDVSDEAERKVYVIDDDPAMRDSLDFLRQRHDQDAGK